MKIGILPPLIDALNDPMKASASAAAGADVQGLVVVVVPQLAEASIADAPNVIGLRTENDPTLLVAVTADAENVAGLETDGVPKDAEASADDG